MNPEIDPNLTTDSALAGILTELKARESIFHRPERTSRTDFERMTVPDFWEVGASGRRYSRDLVLDERERRYSGEYDDRWETKDFHCRESPDEVYLLTYTLFQATRQTRRAATIWQRTDTGSEDCVSPGHRRRPRILIDYVHNQAVKRQKEWLLGLWQVFSSDDTILC
jgi:hypothetical protein